MPRSTPSASRTKPTPRNEILDELRAAVDAADLRIILGVFKADVAAQLSDLRTLVSAQDYTAARSVAHRLAGLLGQFGATTAAERAHQLAKGPSSIDGPASAKAVTALERAARQAVAAICATTAKAAPRPASHAVQPA